MSNRNNNFLPTPMNQQSMLGYEDYTASNYRQPMQSRLPSFGSTPDIRGGSSNSLSSFQERMIPRHFDSLSILSESPSSVRRLEDTYPSRPRHITTYDQLVVPVLPRPQVDDSRLYNVQQKKALDKLKKSTYNPISKGLISTKTNLYFRDLPVSEKRRTIDEGGKRCAICLEDFEPRQEVMLTPCNHMFHEECIVPWAKSNGQCPVCRFAFAEKITRDSNTTSMQPITNNTTTAYLWATHDLTMQDLISRLMIS